jgi:hypothetical protein
MKTYRKRDIFIFWAALIAVGVGVGFSFRYIKAVQTQASFQPTSTANIVSPKSSSTPITVSSTITVGSSNETTTKTTSTPPLAAAPAVPATSSIASQTKTLPYSIGTFNNTFVSGDGWLNWWGGSSESGGVLTLQATATTTGGGVLLQGSDAWTNLTFQANVDWKQGETFGMIARYIDDNNYIVCQFDERALGAVHLRLDEHLNGQVIHLADGDVLNYEEEGGSNIIAAIQLSGNQGICAFNGYIISSLADSDTISPALSHGEIGFTSWDPALDNSQIIVNNMAASTNMFQLGTYVQQTPED